MHAHGHGECSRRRHIAPRGVPPCSHRAESPRARRGGQDLCGTHGSPSCQQGRETDYRPLSGLGPRRLGSRLQRARGEALGACIRSPSSVGRAPDEEGKRLCRRQPVLTAQRHVILQVGDLRRGLGLANRLGAGIRLMGTQAQPGGGKAAGDGQEPHGELRRRGALAVQRLPLGGEACPPKRLAIAAVQSVHATEDACREDRNGCPRGRRGCQECLEQRDPLGGCEQLGLEHHHLLDDEVQAPLCAHAQQDDKVHSGGKGGGRQQVAVASNPLREGLEEDEHVLVEWWPGDGQLLLRQHHLGEGLQGRGDLLRLESAQTHRAQGREPDDQLVHRRVRWHDLGAGPEDDREVLRTQLHGQGDLEAPHEHLLVPKAERGKAPQHVGDLLGLKVVYPGRRNLCHGREQPPIAVPNGGECPDRVANLLAIGGMCRAPHLGCDA
mmetsp:Transcript_4629/g.14890  ORF Transcript_4629/g.14890 Transcript_4629/m.14890 type:complete len:439 (-) Transcript_4629:771-2087(-)